MPNQISLFGEVVGKMGHSEGIQQQRGVEPLERMSQLLAKTPV
jgi:hypothetical protein